MSEESPRGLRRISFLVKESNLPDYELAAKLMHARGIIPEPDVRQIAYVGFKYLLKKWTDEEEELRERSKKTKPLSVRERYLERPDGLKPPQRQPIGEVY